MIAPAKPITAEELLHLPTGQGVRYELVEGELREMSPAGQRHGTIAARLMIRIGHYVLANNLGTMLMAETGFLLRRNPDTVRAPDMAFIPADRIPPEGVPQGYGELVPALVVEVVSPGDTAAEIERKTQEWLAFGVSQVWVAYPEGKRVHVFEAGGRATIYGGDALSGFSLITRTIFED